MKARHHFATLLNLIAIPFTVVSVFLIRYSRKFNCYEIRPDLFVCPGCRFFRFGFFKHMDRSVMTGRIYRVCRRCHDSIPF